MKLPSFSFSWMAFVLALNLVTVAFGDDRPSEVRVRAVLGNVTYAGAGSAESPLKVGERLGQGTTIKTGPRSAVDIYLGANAGKLRLTQNSTLVLSKLAHLDAVSEKQIEVQVDLVEGTLLGIGNSLSTAATYEIKVSNGIAAVGASDFRIDAKGHIVVLNGTVLFAHVPVGGDPVAHKVQAPPATYFSPPEGVKPAPAALVREVMAQTKPRLPEK
jgi:hypothetical protein